MQGKQEFGAGTYDAECAREELAKAIIMHEYPLSIVDHLGFRRYSAALQPVFQVPTRNTIKKEIMKIYENERATTLKLLDNLDGRVTITSNMWTSTSQKMGYMAITAHYVDGCCNLQSQILRFIYVSAPHTSDKLCKVLTDCLMDWNIDTEFSTITLDNCTTNDAMIDKIKDPRFKMELLEYYYEKLYEHDSFTQVRCIQQLCYDLVSTQVRCIQQLCYDLVSDYQMKMNKDSFGSNVGDVTGSEVVGDALSEYDRFIIRKKGLEVLMFNGVKYPTLQAIAKDILAILVSIVASKSAFSTGGQILSPHRSRLQWTTLEALMCARNWLWSAENNGSMSYKVVDECATVMNEIVSNDEGGMMGAGVTNLEE
ncbi:Zinc finger BED domain-containing protein RICESLEEPER 3 [Glycine max]|nr:Zinc finger BED domain-containing protein RICESLEEPER 3 [Glycine max]